MSTILSDSPVAYYTFDNVTGGVVADVTGNGHDGTASSGCTSGTEAAATGIGGASMGFDGASGNVSLAGSFGGESCTAFTIEAWVKLDTLAPGFQAIVADADLKFCHFQIANSEYGTPPWQWEKGTVQVSAYRDDESAFIANGTTTIAADEWAYLATVLDTSGNFKIYVNGVSSGYTVPHGDPSATFNYIAEATSICIGSGYDGVRFLDGLIDEVAIYDTALTASQIAAHYAAAGGITYLPGDANFSGTVDDADAAILAANWQKSSTVVGWVQGDFNNDGAVDDSDATILATNWQNGVGSSTASVPEPSTAVLLIAAAAALLGLVRRRIDR